VNYVNSVSFASAGTLRMWDVDEYSRTSEKEE
jgi:hypothetical protein